MDAVKITFEFDVNDSGLHPPHLARILLDAQCLVMACLALSGELPTGVELFADDSARRYERLIGVQGEELGESGITLSRIQMESPLRMDLLAKLRGTAKKSFAAALSYLKHQLLIDLKREEMEVSIRLREEEVLAKREEVVAKRIENAMASLELLEKIPERSRKKFFDGLSRTVLAFVTEHPTLKSLDLSEKDEKTRAWLPLNPPPPPKPTPQEPPEDGPTVVTPDKPSPTEAKDTRRHPFGRILIIIFLSIGALAALAFLFVMALNFITAYLRP